MTEELQWYYSLSGAQHGPISGQELRQLAQNGIITPQTSVWCDGMGDWLPASQIENLFPPAPAFQTQPQPTSRPNDTSPDYPNVSVAKASYLKFLLFNLIIPLICLTLFAVIMGVGVQQDTTLTNQGEQTVPDINLDAENEAGIESSDFNEIAPPISEAKPISVRELFALALFLTASICGLIGIITAFTLLHRAWRILQPAGARTTPGKAVGLHFIPLFSFYWNFVSFHGLSQDWNRAMTSYQNTRQAPLFATGNFLTFAICAIIAPPIASNFTNPEAPIKILNKHRSTLHGGKVMERLYFSFILGAALPAQPLTYDTNPLGQIEKPLMIRTYLPDPGLEPAVLANHATAAKSPVYNPSDGRDHAGEYEMMKVIPAAIAVNHGPALSYVFDTTECRVLYAWQGGFLDFFPYWGDQAIGGRRSFDYVPRLVGNLFYLAQAEITEKTGKPVYLGYDLDKNGVPTFRYTLDGTPQSLTITPSQTELSYELVRTIADGEPSQKTVTGKILSRHQGFDRTIKIDQPSAEAGEQVFTAYACLACHSLDGSTGHGPTLAGLFGKTRPIEGGGTTLVDDAYLRESILEPNAKTAKGFPQNYMPPFQLKKEEIESLILYIKTLKKDTPD